MRECERVLAKAGLNVVGELLRGQGEFIEFDHYPKGEVYDHETHCQYYYHAHGERLGEHGHFHTFFRTGELANPPLPAPRRADADVWPEGADAVAHLVGVAMDDWGRPLSLFVCNRWVTGDTWYPAATLNECLARFEIDHAWPSWASNRWLTAFLRLFAPHIQALFRERDRVVSRWQRLHPEQDALEDRRLEILASVPVSIANWLHALHAAR